ncbi:unnamed protein product [Darwinula stevensoni]|uniref:glutaminyl-peptide cyclotransferase n=1 Tax=Darwinula stevensoni TaxID=69355 RepID=A0A7R9A2M7_9CRUS|nr:unnamed protein product [Darwinula stevensoni]CAG0879813.1 unnamed protein product [Darwinula stevensoni]
MSLSRSILMIINLLLGVCRAQNPATCPLNREHDAYAGNVQKLADDKTQYLASLNNNEAFLSLLHPIMIRRVPGTTNHALVRKHIIDTLESYEWTVETDDFTSKIPYVDEDMNGQVPFSNIIATWDPRASRRLILACHYDSLYQNRHSNFIGATDSAVPCAILLDVARTLTPYLRQQQEVSINVLNKSRKN